MSLRGRYTVGHVTVTARRWWSLKERRDAKRAAVIADAFYRAEAERITRAAVRAMVYGEATIRPLWRAEDA